MALDLTAIARQAVKLTGVSDGPAEKIDATDVKDAINRAFKRIAQHLTRRVKTYLTTVANQQTYQLAAPYPDFIHSVYPSYVGSEDWSSFVWDSGAAVLSGLGGVGAYGGGPTNMADHPSMREAYLQRVAHIRRFAPFDPIYNASTGILTLIPCPTQVVRVYYEAGYVWDLVDDEDDVPDSYEPMLLEFTKYELFQVAIAARARLAGMSATGAPTMYGNLSTLRDQAKDALKEGERLMKVQKARDDGLVA